MYKFKTLHAVCLLIITACVTTNPCTVLKYLVTNCINLPTCFGVQSHHPHGIHTKPKHVGGFYGVCYIVLRYGVRVDGTTCVIKMYSLNKKIYFLRSTNFKLLRQIKGNLINDSTFLKFVISVTGGHCCCSPLYRLEASGKYTYIYMCIIYRCMYHILWHLKTPYVVQTVHSVCGMILTVLPIISLNIIN
jgi:hypothetical protein